MTRRAIDARDLDAATRARLGIGAPGQGSGKADPPARPPRDEHAIAVKRGHTGRSFEADLSITHQQYAVLKWGKLWPHAPPFLRVNGEWRPKAGGGPVDYTGHVVVVRVGATLRGSTARAPGARLVPVAFDAKVGDARSAIYHHEQKRQHQLHTLREASMAGVAAFLLVLMPQLDRPNGRLFAIDVAAHFTELVGGDGVRLFEPAGRVTIASPHAAPFLLLPSIGLRETPAIAGWDWIPLLDWITNAA